MQVVTKYTQGYGYLAGVLRTGRKRVGGYCRHWHSTEKQAEVCGRAQVAAIDPAFPQADVHVDHVTDVLTVRKGA